ncbi:MAG TPA: hypothetical protein VHX87_12240 [Galbitalea sp.]|nr:hypothetical protein [Galbitalea sp.]
MIPSKLNPGRVRAPIDRVFTHIEDTARWSIWERPRSSACREHGD